MKAEIQECAAGSTMHGLPKAVNQQIRPIRILWIVFCVIATTFMFTHFAYLFNRFSESHVATSFSVNRSSTNLPSIIFCTYLMSMPTVETLLSSVLDPSISKMSKSSVMQTIADLLVNGSIKADVRSTPQYFLMRCVINEIDCTDESNWKLVGEIDKHRCFELIPPANMIDEDPTKVEVYVYMDSVSDSNSELRHRIDEVLEYDFTIYLLAMESPEKCIDPYAGLKIAPGSQYDVSLRSFSSILKPLSLQDVDIPKCNYNQPRSVGFCSTRNYMKDQLPYNCYEDTTLCLANRIQELALAKCNETSRYHNSHYIATCPVASNRRAQRKMDDSQCMRNILTDRRLIERLAVFCTPCEELEWKSSVLYSTWPREDMAWFFNKGNPINYTRFQVQLKDKLQSSLGFVPANSLYKIFNLSPQSDVAQVREIYGGHIAYIKMDIDLDVEVMTEELAYPFISFMSEVGGIMGLWLGCSVMTFLEPIELLFRVVVQHRRHKKNKDSPA